jgi:hypothetical protein
MRERYLCLRMAAENGRVDGSLEGWLGSGPWPRGFSAAMIRVPISSGAWAHCAGSSNDFIFRSLHRNR